jgi:hypothetical protein
VQRDTDHEFLHFFQVFNRCASSGNVARAEDVVGGAEDPGAGTGVR